MGNNCCGAGAGKNDAKYMDLASSDQKFSQTRAPRKGKS